MLVKALKYIKDNIVLTVIVAGTVLHGIILGFQLPLLTHRRGWFWQFIPKSTGPIWAIFLLITILITVILLVTKISGRYKLRLFLLIVLGAGLQFNFAFLENRRIDGIKDRIIKTGHAEFAEIAVEQKDILYVLKNYESLLEQGELGKYANSKPPGTLLFYMLTNDITKLIYKDHVRTEALDHLRTVASYLWPFLSYIVLIPLFYFASIVFGKDTALIACALYVVVPSVNLITLQTDQVIYPFLSVMSVQLAASAARRNSPWMSLSAGIFIYLTWFFTFSLVFVMPFAIASCYYICFRTKDKSQVSRFFKILIFVTAGILLADIIFRWFLNYDILLRYRNAMLFHRAWKQWRNDFLLTIYYGVLNLIEYTLWVGIPLITLFLFSFRDSAVRLYHKKEMTFQSILAILLFIIFILIAFLGKTKGEVARLWLFLVPYVCMISANFIMTKQVRFNPWFFRIIMFLQFGIIYLTKIHQDFW